ncbi:CoA ester lyase [Paraburkholderia fungorum]|uniref:HpcH/HpaI aldolase/citrate lyase family protein n=1 Tax=Paraburkholderia fungorum TaxID=134537 RepID=UPI0038B7855C
MIFRSYLFVPADRPERFAKALATAAHQVVIDLEDALMPEVKAHSREKLATWLRTELADADRSRVVVRVNAFGTPWHADDVLMVHASPVRNVMVPKAEEPGQLGDIGTRCGDGVALTALVETVAGLVNMRKIAGERAVARLAFGSFDYCVDAGIDGFGRELDYVRSRFVVESRYAGLPPPIDGVTLAIDDAAVIAEDVALGRRFGFGGKLCIHPKQVDAVNRGFAPSDDDRAWAARVLAAVAANPHGAIAVDGKLVDKPIIDRARRIEAG